MIFSVLCFVLLFDAFYIKFATQVFQCSMPHLVFSHFSDLRFPTGCVCVSFSGGDGLGGFRLPTSALSLCLTPTRPRRTCHLVLGDKLVGQYFSAVLREWYVSASSIQLCWRAAARADSFVAHKFVYFSRFVRVILKQEKQKRG